MAIKKEISLLPDEVNANSVSARIIRWISTVGRFVIVFTELFVIGAFLSRFWLDRKNSDLSETIRQQKAILESTKDFENQFNSLQNRLKLIKSGINNQPDYAQRLDSLSQSTPQQIVYQTVNLTHDPDGRIYSNLTVTAYDEAALVDFITNLILNPDLDSVSVRTIEKKPKESSYTAVLELIFKVKLNKSNG